DPVGASQTGSWPSPHGMTVNQSRITETELRGEGASFGPSVVPYPTLPVTQTAAWTTSGNCTVTQGVTGPDGMASAASTIDNAGGSASYTFYNYNVTPKVGDTILYGMWVQNPTGALQPSTPSGDSFYLGGGSAGTFQFDNFNNGTASVI